MNSAHGYTEGAEVPQQSQADKQFKNMKTGIELIAEERREQIEKHGRTLNDDVKFNTKMQLRSAAHRLVEIDPSPFNVPYDWDKNIWEKMCRKPMKERLIIAGALIAAEIDRMQNSNEEQL